MIDRSRARNIWTQRANWIDLLRKVRSLAARFEIITGVKLLLHALNLAEQI